MFLWLVPIFLLLSGALSSREGSAVLELTTQSFSVTDKGSWLVEFYAPWCSVCQKLQPIWEEAATRLKGSKLTLAAVDCTVETELKSKFNIKGFPEILFIRNGESRKYKKGRMADDIVDFAAAMALPATTDITVADLSQALSNATVVFVLATVDKLDKTYAKVAHQLQGVHSLRTSKDPALHTKFALKPGNIVALTEQGDNPVLAAPWDETALRAFLKLHKLPWLSTLGPETFEDLTQEPGKRTAYIAVKPKEADQDFRAKMITVAKKHPDFRFGLIDVFKYDKYLSQFDFQYPRDQPPYVFVLDFDNEVPSGSLVLC